MSPDYDHCVVHGGSLGIITFSPAINTYSAEMFYPWVISQILSLFVSFENTCLFLRSRGRRPGILLPGAEVFPDWD
jgi:hypothetical protein